MIAVLHMAFVRVVLHRVLCRSFVTLLAGQRDPCTAQFTWFVDCLRSCSSLRGLEAVYGCIIKKNAMQHCFLMNQFITACATFRCIELATDAFTQLNKANIFVYNALIGSFLRSFCPLQALQLYMVMLRAQISPTSYTLTSIVKSCTLVSDLKLGDSIHGQIWKYGLESNVYVQTVLIDFYSNLGKLVESRLVFDRMPEKDGFSWTTMVSAHVRFGDLSSAKKLFDEMPEKNTAAWNSIIHGFAGAGDVESARGLFDKMPQKDLISWTTMINCYSRNKSYKEALDVFNQIKGVGLIPDEVTLSTVISACAHTGLLHQGKEIHLYVAQNYFNLDVYIGSALVDMYAKCGDMEKSLLVFYKLREKNLFVWNSVIDGLAVHGYANEALCMFHIMEKEKIEPNAVTFVSVLTACSHAGLIEVGRSSFLKMIRDYCLLPEIEHYGCMVDLFCKGGLLEEALHLIKSMRMEPNSVIWGALLGGCKIHKNLDIAQMAVDRLAVLEPKNTGYFAILINMYVEANRWLDVARIRVNMKNLGVEKISPGFSWI